MKPKVAALFLFLLFSTSVFGVPANMQNYCMQPPFLTATYEPNVMVIMDTSGSMGCRAYGDGSFDPNRTYYGYFEADQWYVYQNNRFEIDQPKSTGRSNQDTTWDGNFLNWLTMRRMDVVRKVLIGGKTSGRSGTGNPHTLLGEPVNGLGTPGNCSGDTDFQNSVSNADDYSPFRQATQVGTRGSFNARNAIQVRDITPAFTISGTDATSATISWTLSHSGSGADLTNCVSARLRAPDNISELTLKSFGQSNSGLSPASVLSFYQTHGAGTYKIVLEEQNSCGGTGTATINNVTLTVQGTLSNPTVCFTFQSGSTSSKIGVNTTSLNSCPAAGSGTLFDIQTLTATEPQGIIHDVKNKIRLGLQFYNTEQGGQVVESIGETFPANYITDIENVSPGSYTPLAENIWTASGYFAQDNSSTNDGPRYSSNPSYTVSADADPYNYAPPGQTAQMVPCAKSFIILVTDGEPTRDLNLPGSLDNISATYAGSCTHDTNGNDVCTESGNPAVSDCCIDNATLYHRVSLSGTPKMRDLRSDLTGDQFISSYIVFAFGAGSSVLSVAARNGGFEDKNGNFVPDLTSEYDEDNDGVPDNYFEASEGTELESSISSAFADILKRAASSTAASLLASGEGQGANILQAFFFPKGDVGDTQLSWPGYLVNHWFFVDPLLLSSTIREDTVTDDELNLADDKILEFFFDTGDNTAKARLFSDSDANGKKDNATPDSIVPFISISGIWDAGLQLFLQNPSNRVLKTSVDGTTLVDFNVSNQSTFYGGGGSPNFLQANNSADASDIINYTRGTDLTGKRSRTTTINGTTNTWKLGDIIDSTPKIQGPDAINRYHDVYQDATYRSFINSADYKNRGTSYVGSNEGVLHAFNHGKLEFGWSGKAANDKARLSGNNLGSEAWAFIPKNSLPYLRYLMDTDYCHLYYVDATPFLVDASIQAPASCSGEPESCLKRTATDSNGNLDPDETTWRTILIGSMRLGGACGCTTSNCVQTPDGSENGRSAYFALDVTDPTNPDLLWEFSHADLGFSTTGPAILKMSFVENGTPKRDRNGHWYVVIGSGPTGPVDTVTHQFLGRSDQSLKLFVLNLADGNLERVIDTQIPGAFAGSLNNSVFDFTKDYQDEGMYISYTKRNGSNWDRGGVLRLYTHEDRDVSKWTVNHLISDIGPISASVAHVQDRILHESWAFFGTGRLWYRTLGGNYDDPDGQRHLMGLKDPCYDEAADALDFDCTTTVDFDDLYDATTEAFEPTVPTDTIDGWFIALDATSGSLKAERSITNPVAIFSGAVVFTTTAPASDICTAGGSSYLWTVRYNTGGSGAGLLYGLSLAQTSTGQIEQLQLNTAFTEKTASNETKGRRTGQIQGIASPTTPAVIIPKPYRKFILATEK